MHTKMETFGSKVTRKCACSSNPMLLDGYTSMETDLWLPDGLADIFEETYDAPVDGRYALRVAPRTLYSFLAVFNVDLALTLLSYGHKTVDQAMQFLQWSGYAYLATYENDYSAVFACDHGISVDEYLDIIYTHDPRPGSNAVMDALKFIADCPSYGFKGNIANGIAKHDINPSHLYEIGLELVAKCVESEYLYNALKDANDVPYGWDGPGLTSAGIKTLLAKCDGRQEMLRRLKLLNAYDLQTALDVVNHGFINNITPGSRFGQSYNADQILYADKLFGVLWETHGESAGSPVQGKIKRDLVIALQEAHVDQAFAAPLVMKDEPAERIVAMHAGVHTSMTEGWL